ncbi:virulence-associated E family protein [Apilactobacillus nanyangensis]|uniref:Virulence-associated E family protein n=1 Tax=Apilactobacillus nanyangensis TaxID=2799579 RepID=A0ABT0HZ89_9LACO|nr:virulence-associated E family protein [Apilactobacillus nanyangensis]MCK8612227.1 virulence-associated E family protein [Apilactobacillus nanyangensis]
MISDDKVIELQRDKDEYDASRPKDNLRRKANGSIKKTSAFNVAEIFRTDESLSKLMRINGFTGNVELYGNLDAFKLKSDDKISKADIQARAYIEKKYGVYFDDRFYNAGKMNYLITTDYEHEYNPVKNFIKSTEWDGHPRVETAFIDKLGAEDTHLNRMITRKWLVGAVARVFDPGCKMDLVPILVGGQGIGKSTFCKHLTPTDNNFNYFLDDLTELSSNNKDTQIKLKQNWIVEIGELNAFNGTKIESSKQFISQTSDHLRELFEREATNPLRRNAFIGTTNTREFLKDRTGNRRWLPVQVGMRDNIKYAETPYDASYFKQLWAEAYQYYIKGEKPVLDDKTTKELEREQAQFTTSEVSDERIKQFTEMLVPDDWYSDYSLYQKHNYYIKHVFDNRYSDKKANDLNIEDLQPIKQFTKEEIVYCVFGRQETQGKFSKKTSSVLSTVKEFEYKEIKERGKRKRGYKRINM